MKKLFAKEKTGRAFLIYTGIFAILAVLIYLCYEYAGKSFVSNVDAINQHLVTLKTWRSLLLNFLKTGEFNTFTWSIGTGIDLFPDYGYYIIGDFVNYLSILVPESSLYYFYVITLFFRLYLVGISFIIYAKYKKLNNFASINGAVCYAFATITFLSCFRHPYFANAFILLPLLLLGMDKIVLENKKLFYIFVIFITYVSSFYFAYIMSLSLLIYGLILIISTYKKDGIKTITKVLLRVFFCSILGILMSSFTIVPVLAQYFRSNREGAASIFSFIFGYKYYSSITQSLATFSSQQWVALGLNPIIFIVLPLAIKNYKKNSKLLLFALILLITLLIPFLSSIFAGFSFPTNRHSFIISFIMCLLISEYLNSNYNLSKKDLLFIIIFNLIYYAIAFHFGDLDKIAVFTIMCTVLLCILIYYQKEIDKFFSRYNFLKNIYTLNILITIILVGITANRNTLYFDDNDYAADFVDTGKVQYMYNSNGNTALSFNDNVAKITDFDNEYYRIGGTYSKTYNAALYLGYNSISYYYSIVPGILAKLPYDLDNLDYSTSLETNEFNYRTKITTLLGNKYYVMKDNTKLPYGYSLVEMNESGIYINKTPASFAEYYDKYITPEEYEKLNNLQKENSLLKNVVVSKKDQKDLKHNDNYLEEINHDIKKLEYTITGNDKKFVVTNTDNSNKSDKEITIEVEPNQKFNGEIYLKIDNLVYTPYSKKELYNIKKNNEKYSKRDFNKKYEHYDERKTYRIDINFGEKEYKKEFRDPQYESYSTGSNNVLVNLGYYENLDKIEEKEIILKFSAIGEYSYDNLELLLVTFDDYEEDIANLNKTNYKTIEYKNGYMKGTIDLEKSGIIQFTTPYVNGWDLYIDGKKSEIMNVNKYFIGTYMNKGKHTIELKYHTPLVKEGIIITIISTIIYIIVLIFELRKSKVNID